MLPLMPSQEEIIVVDDDESVREAAAEYLQKHGYRVRTAADGAALDTALAEPRRISSFST
jgi:two-component system OmpR family response regulator